MSLEASLTMRGITEQREHSLVHRLLSAQAFWITLALLVMCVAMSLLQPQAFGEMDVMDDENAWTYWSRSDAHAMAMNIGGNAKARTGLCRAIERWIGHLLGIAVDVETVASIEDRDWRWFVGLDSEATRIGNALWNGAALDEDTARRIVALMRLSFRDTRLVDERVGDKPVYLILAMDADKVVRLKPQNLVVGLPLASTANVA